MQLGPVFDSGFRPFMQLFECILRSRDRLEHGVDPTDGVGAFSKIFQLEPFFGDTGKFWLEGHHSGHDPNPLTTNHMRRYRAPFRLDRIESHWQGDAEPILQALAEHLPVFDKILDAEFGSSHGPCIAQRLIKPEFVEFLIVIHSLLIKQVAGLIGQFVGLEDHDPFVFALLPHGKREFLDDFELLRGLGLATIDQLAFNRPKLGLATFWHMTKAGKPMSDSISGSGGVHDRCDPCIGIFFKKA